MRDIVWKRMAFPHDGQDHEIIIAGVKHAAPLEFWTPLTEMIDKCIANNWPVHMEGIRPHSEPSGPIMTRRAENLRFFAKLSVTFEGVGGLVSQNTVLNIYKDYITNNDLTMVDMLKLSPIFPLWTLTGALPAMFNYLLSRPDVRENLGEQIRNLNDDDTEKTAKQKRRQRTMLWFLTGVYPDVLLNARNAVAAYGAMQERETTLLVWGAAHVPGIVEILKENGYIEVDSDHGAWYAQ